LKNGKKGPINGEGFFPSKKGVEKEGFLEKSGENATESRKRRPKTGEWQPLKRVPWGTLGERKKRKFQRKGTVTGE